MVDVTRTLNLPSSMSATVTMKYVLYLPDEIRVYDSLSPGTTTHSPPYMTYGHGAFYMDSMNLYVPLDLITAARLKMIRRGDDSGIGDEQWAWMKLIGLVKGEN